MKDEIKWLITLIILSIFAIFISFLLSTSSYAGDYIITLFGNGEIVVIEHDGMIHAVGIGTGMGLTSSREYINYRPDGTNLPPFPLYSDNQSNSKILTDLDLAQKYESQGFWYISALHYREAENLSKMEEMLLEYINRELSKALPDYTTVVAVAENLLEDRDLALEYYEKHLDQKFNKRE